MRRWMKRTALYCSSKTEHRWERERESRFSTHDCHFWALCLSASVEDDIFYVCYWCYWLITLKTEIRAEVTAHAKSTADTSFVICSFAWCCAGNPLWPHSVGCFVGVRCLLSRVWANQRQHRFTGVSTVFHGGKNCALNCCVCVDFRTHLPWMTVDKTLETFITNVWMWVNGEWVTGKVQK